MKKQFHPKTSHLILLNQIDIRLFIKRTTDTVVLRVIRVGRQMRRVDRRVLRMDKRMGRKVLRVEKRVLGLEKLVLRADKRVVRVLRVVKQVQ